MLSDFARLEAETSTAEDQAQSAYSSFMDESNEDIARGDDTVGNPPRAQVYILEPFECILFLK